VPIFTLALGRGYFADYTDKTLSKTKMGGGGNLPFAMQSSIM
jgi:hypothetical protein